MTRTGKTDLIAITDSIALAPDSPELDAASERFTVSPAQYPYGIPDPDSKPGGRGRAGDGGRCKA